MRVRIYVSAKYLPESADSYAIVSFEGGDEIGSTELVAESDSPDWEKGFVFDSDDGSNVTIVVLSGEDGEIGSASFDIEAVMEERGKVCAKDMEGGGTIFIYAAEHCPTGNFVYQICGKGLKNTEGFLGLSRGKSDPYYELQGTSGEILFASEVIHENLDPIWEKHEIDLASLCDGDLDGTIKFSIFDQDPDGKRDFMGEFETSVNRLVSIFTAGEEIELTRYDKEAGVALVLAAELSDYMNLRETVKEVVDATAKVMVTAADAVSKLQVATAALEDAEKAKTAAEEKEEKTRILEEELEEAKAAASEAETAAQEAAEAVAAQVVEGILALKIQGNKFQNTEGLFRKPDPFFVVQKKDADGAEEAWSNVQISPVCKDTLDPDWPEVEIDLRDLITRDLTEPLRLVFYDRESDGKHELMGFLETSIDVLQAAQGGDPLLMEKGGDETGQILVSGVVVHGYIDPMLAEDKAKELAEKSEEAKFFVMGKNTATKIAREDSEAKREYANEKISVADTANEEAGAAKEAAEEADSILERILSLV